MFVGYSESSKAYKIYIPKQHKVEFSRYVTFDEKLAFKKSIEDFMEEEYEEPKEESTSFPESHNEEPEQLDHPVKPCRPIESVNIPKTRKCPSWLEATVQEAEGIKAPSGTFRERKKPKILFSYASCITKLINE
jgi:hypothetical protein